MQRGYVWRKCRPRVVRTTGSLQISTVGLFEWSIGAMRCGSNLLMNNSIYVHSSLPSQCLNEFSSHHFSVSLCVHSCWTSVSILKQYRPIMPLRPNAHQTITFSTLSGRDWCSWDWGWAWACAQKLIFCLFIVHVITKLGICLFIYHWKKWSPGNQAGLPTPWICARGAVLWNRLKHFRLESPSEIVVEFGQLI